LSVLVYISEDDILLNTDQLLQWHLFPMFIFHYICPHSQHLITYRALLKRLTALFL